MRLPPLPEVLNRCAVAFAMVEAAYLGDERTGAELIQPLRDLGPQIDTFATIPAPALARLHMDPSSRSLDKATARSSPTPQPLRSTPWWRWPGRPPRRRCPSSRSATSAARWPTAPGGALPKIDANYLVFAGGFAPTPEAVDAVRAQAQALGTPSPPGTPLRLLQLRRNSRRRRRRAPARLLLAPAADQGYLRPRPDDHLHAPRLALQGPHVSANDARILTEAGACLAVGLTLFPGP